jgi:predicted alpha/beta superfamily hydrolase
MPDPAPVDTTSSTAAAPAEAARVVVLDLTSRVFGNTRAVRVYLPPGYANPAGAARRYPTLYFNDGFAVFAPHLWNAPRIADSLIAAGAMVPAILVGIDNAASIAGSRTPGRDRANEYLPYPDSTEAELPSPRGSRYPEFLDEARALVDSAFRTAPGAENVGVAGSSYGGIAALYTVLRSPGTFGMLLLESTPLFLFDQRLVAESASLAVWPAVYVGVGTRESDDERLKARGVAALERFVAIARSKGSRVTFNRAEGARHNAAAWRARLPAALVFLLGTDRR